MSLTTLAVPLCLLSVAAPPAPLELPPGLLAYEPFDLKPGEPVLGSDGGLGWAGEWVRSDWRMVEAPLRSRHPRRADRLAGAEEPLEVAGLSFAGGAAATPALYPDIGALTRRIGPRLGRAGSTVYVGLLVRADGTLHRGTGWGFLTVTLDCGVNEYGDAVGVAVTFGKPCDPARTARGIARGGEWCLGSLLTRQQALRVAGRPYSIPGTPAGTLHGGGRTCGGSRVVTTGVPVTAGPITQLVLKVEFAPRRGERYGLFVNPDPSKPEPPPPAAIAIDVSNHGRRRFPTWITLASSGAFTVDEIRVADSLAGACGYSPPADETDGADAGE